MFRRMEVAGPLSPSLSKGQVRGKRTGLTQERTMLIAQDLKPRHPEKEYHPPHKTTVRTALTR